ncbi:hypothetical protein ACOMHN_014797 [Nucella lapillus]
MSVKRGTQKRRAGNKKRTTVRAVHTAIQKYPRSQGASVREIYRLITKSEPEKTKRSVSSVKVAIARAVRTGSIRAPKGWPGFPGIPMRDNKAGGGKGKGRNSAIKKKNQKASSQGSPSDRSQTPGIKASTTSRTQSLSSGESQSQSPKGRAARPGIRGQGTRSLSRGKSQSRGGWSPRRGARGRSGVRGQKRQGRSRGPHPKKKNKRISNSNNSRPADSSTNYNEGDSNEEGVPPSSLCPANICVIS